MRQITIRSISLEGYRSYAVPTKFQFNTTGLHLIKGANGEGKTTLFSALSWCLYKVNLNATNNDRIPTFKWRRTPEYKGTRVQVVLGVGRDKYLIARHMGYSGKTKGLEGNDSLLIFKKEKVDKTPFTSADIVNDPLYTSDAQAYLNTLLGIDDKIFLNSILFGQRMTRLMESKNADKRDLFERMFDVGFIDDLKDRAAIKQGEISDKLRTTESELSVATNSRDLLQQQLDDAENIVAEFKERKKAAMNKMREDHTEIKKALAETEAQIAATDSSDVKADSDKVSKLAAASDRTRDAYYTVKESMQFTTSDSNEASRNLTSVEKEIELLWKQLRDTKGVCAVCGSKLKPEAVTAARRVIETTIADKVADSRVYQARIASLTNQLDTMNADLKVKLKYFEDANDAYLTAKRQYAGADGGDSAKLISQQVELRTRLSHIKNAFDAEKAREAPTVNIAAINSKLAAIKATIPELEKKIKSRNNYLKRLAWWQQAFGANGLKAYVFSASLNNLNNCLAVYTSYFGMSIVFGIDLNKKSKPFYCTVKLDGEHEVEYSDLSGGQKQRVDLCISFAMQDAAETKSSFNLSIFDEPADGLDEVTQELLDTLLRIRAETKAVYVISHYNMMDLSGATTYEISGGNKATSVIE